MSTLLAYFGIIWMRGALLGFEPSGHDRDDGPPGPFGVLGGWEVLSLKKKIEGCAPALSNLSPAPQLWLLTRPN